MSAHLLHFEWDEQKALLNLRKHGVSFEEASLSFFDERFIRRVDIKHSVYETRYGGIGRITSGKLLVTTYTERGDNIRIISSRKANKKEKLDYENFKE